MTAEQRALVVPTALQRAANSLPAMRAAAEADALFLSWWDGGLEGKLKRSQSWLAESAGRIDEELRR